MEQLLHTIEIKSGDFPGGPMVKNLPSNAKDMGSIPGQGTKILHTAWQISPQLLSLCTLWSTCCN